jgi:hypothetical protein
MYIRNTNTVEVTYSDETQLANVEVETSSVTETITLTLDRSVDSDAENDAEERGTVSVPLSVAEAVELIGYLSEAVGALLKRTA